MFTSMKFLPLCALAVSAVNLPYMQVQRNSAYTTAIKGLKVPVQLGVMSACPDALLCETLFIDVLKETEDKVNLSLVYVARLDDSDPDFGVWCKHGPRECAGNVQQLCVKKYAPWPNWWDFVQCQNSEGKSEIGKPEVAFKCAEAAGINWDTSGAGECAGFDASGTGEEGIDLLKQSLQYGQELGITKSCTILINERKVCVHDSTWKECETGHEVADFVNQIEDEYRRLNEVEVKYPEPDA